MKSVLELHQEIIEKPLISEKGTTLGQLNQYVFKVSNKANRTEIRDAIEVLFKVKVEKVRTLIIHGKPKGARQKSGHRPNWKKAYVTLASGNKIELFQGV